MGAASGNADPIGRFLEALARRDFDALAAALRPDVRLRAILPARIADLSGADAVAAQYRAWFGATEQLAVAGRSVEDAAGRARVWYRIELRKDGARRVVEQHGLFDADADGIRRIDLVCTGFRPLVEAAGDGFRFDAGGLACGDGLTELFRQAIASVPVGARLAVAATDASARAELPSFARLSGHEVADVEEVPGGGIVVTIERKR